MKTTPWRIPLVTALLIGLLACTGTPAADSERVALETAIHRWMTAVNAQDSATLAATMTGDVEMIDSTSTVTGRDAAIRALRDAAAQGTLVGTSRELTIAGDVAWHVVGIARTRKNGDVLAGGQVLEIWKRVDGQWRLHRRMTSVPDATADLLTRPSTKEPVLDRPRD